MASGELAGARAFIASFGRHVRDAADVAVHVISTRAEAGAVRAVLAAVAAFDLTVHAYEDLADASPADAPPPVATAPTQLVRELGGDTFRSLQRLTALARLSYDQALVVDTDALVLKSVHLGDVFDDYFAAPYVYYSDPAVWGERWFGTEADAVVNSAARLLAQPYPRMFFGEYRGAFYEKRVVADVWTALAGDPVRAIRSRLVADRRVSEAQLVWTYVAAKRDAYGYRFVSAADTLREYLGADAYDGYVRSLRGDAPVTGLLDAVALALTERNLPALQRLFDERRLRFFRFDPRNANADLQRRLIDATPIAFLAASPAFRTRRIAVCLSGMPRNARQNLRFTTNFLAGTAVDVFAHFWDTPDQDYIVRQLRPTAYAFEPTSMAPPPPAYRRLEKMVKPQQMAGTSSMFYSIGRANALKSAYESANGFRYDVVVRMRLDFFSTQTLADVLERIDAQRAGWDGVVYVPDMAHSAGLNDQLAVGSSDTMDAYAAVLGTLPQIAAEDYYNPEYILLRHLLRSGLRIRTFPFEYVLLRGDRVATFDLREHVDRTLTTWWSSPLPEIAQHAVNDYFAAQADSVQLIDELDADLARVFRLRSGRRGYLRYDAERRAFDFVAGVADASLFYVVIPSNEDRTVVNIRARELVFASLGRSDAGSAANSLYPERDGSVRADGPSDADSAFFIRRRGSGVVFEWRPGFWKRPDDDRGESPRAPGGRTAPPPDESATAQRFALQPSDGGLSLAPLTPESEAFDVEYVHDPAAEAVAFGLRADAHDRIGVKSESLPVRLLRFTYLAARLVDQRGVRVMSDTARSYVRKRAYHAELTNAPGLANRIVRRLANRL